MLLAKAVPNGRTAIIVKHIFLNLAIVVPCEFASVSRRVKTDLHHPKSVVRALALSKMKSGMPVFGLGKSGLDGPLFMRFSLIDDLRDPVSARVNKNRMLVHDGVAIVTPDP